jgi:two-component system, NarL family, nitrate/nitrite response regulator NarL
VITAQIRVLVADRHPLLREAMARAVRQRAAFRLVAEIDDGRLALAAIRRDAPDIAILDLGLPGLDGARVLNAIVRDRLPTRVLLFADVPDSAAAYEAIAAGAMGWLSKAADADELCAAVATAARGEVALTADAQTAIAAEIRRRTCAGDPVLDRRESRVLSLVAAGWSASEIGRELNLSTGTVKSTLVKLYRRLGVSERAAAVAVAMRRGLIE